MAKKALIDTNDVINIEYTSSWELVDGEYQSVDTVIENCNRVLDVVEANATFEVTPNLQWIDCPDDCTSATYYYKNNTFTQIPEEPVNPGL